MSFIRPSMENVRSARMRVNGNPGLWVTGVICEADVGFYLPALVRLDGSYGGQGDGYQEKELNVKKARAPHAGLLKRRIERILRFQLLAEDASQTDQASSEQS